MKRIQWNWRDRFAEYQARANKVNDASLAKYHMELDLRYFLKEHLFETKAEMSEVFGFIETYIRNHFVELYGLTIEEYETKWGEEWHYEYNCGC